jgi:hypothetical protein
MNQVKNPFFFSCASLIFSSHLSRLPKARLPDDCEPLKKEKPEPLGKGPGFFPDAGQLPPALPGRGPRGKIHDYGKGEFAGNAVEPHRCPLLHKTYIMKRTMLPGSLIRRRHLVKGPVVFLQAIASGLLQRLVPEFLEKPEIPGGRDAKPDA